MGVATIIYKKLTEAVFKHLQLLRKQHVS